MTKQFARECQLVREQRKTLVQNHLPEFLRRYFFTLCPLAVASGVLLATRSAWSLLLVVCVCGLTQNALTILMHEGSHVFFHSDRTTNDRLANWLVCLPIFNTVQGYRGPHLEHHRSCCDESDPYFGLYGPYERKSQVLFGFVMDLTGVTALRTFARRYGQVEPDTVESPWANVMVLAVVQGLIFGIWFLLVGRWWGYLLWVVPLMTIPIAINRLRTFVEHHHEQDGSEGMRTATPNFIEYLAIAPYGYAHHFEHHLMPEIPYYQLAWARTALESQTRTDAPAYFAKEGYLRSFLRLLAELR